MTTCFFCLLFVNTAGVTLIAGLRKEKAIMAMIKLPAQQLKSYRPIIGIKSCKFLIFCYFKSACGDGNGGDGDDFLAQFTYDSGQVNHKLPAPAIAGSLYCLI